MRIRIESPHRNGRTFVRFDFDPPANQATINRVFAIFRKYRPRGGGAMAGPVCGHALLDSPKDAVDFARELEELGQ